MPAAVHPPDMARAREHATDTLSTGPATWTVNRYALGYDVPASESHVTVEYHCKQAGVELVVQDARFEYQIQGEGGES